MFSSAFLMSDKDKNGLQRAIGSSYSVLGALGLFGAGGYWLDKYRGNDNFWVAIGLLLGVVVGLYELSKYILKKWFY